MSNPDSSRENYPYLRSFLRIQFQENLEDWSLPVVVNDFIETTQSANVLGTRADIQRFLHEHGNEPDVAFERLFRPKVDIAAYDLTTTEWLRQIDDLLASHVQF